MVSGQTETKSQFSLIKRKRRPVSFTLLDSRDVFLQTAFEGRKNFSYGSLKKKKNAMESVCLQENLPSLCPLRIPPPASLHIQSSVISGGRTTMFSQGGWLHCSPPAVARPWQGKKLVQHVSRFKKKCLLPPFFSNTTQVLGNLLRQVGLGKMCAK